MTTEAQKELKRQQRLQVKLGHQKLLLLHVNAAKLPLPVFEYQFHPTRQWKIDAAWPEYKLAVEIEGGIYMGRGTGHRSITGFEAGLEKYNQLAIEGWFLIRILPEWLKENRNEARLVLEKFFETYT